MRHLRIRSLREPGVAPADKTGRLSPPVDAVQITSPGVEAAQKTGIASRCGTAPHYVGASNARQSAPVYTGVPIPG